MTSSKRGGRRRRTAAAQGAPEDRQAAHGLLAALARAPAQRPLRGRGQARGLPLARRLQADRDRRQAPPAEAGQARRRPWRRARRLGPGGGRRGCARRERQGPGGRHRPSARWSRSPASSSCSSISWTRRRRRGCKALLREGKADVVLSDMAAQGTGHARTDHLRIMALAEAAAEFACEVLVARRRLPLQGVPGRHRARAARRLKRAFSTVRHVKPPASRRVGRALRARDGLQGRCRATLP